MPAELVEAPPVARLTFYACTSCGRRTGDLYACQGCGSRAGYVLTHRHTAACVELEAAA